MYLLLSCLILSVCLTNLLTLVNRYWWSNGDVLKPSSPKPSLYSRIMRTCSNKLARTIRNAASKKWSTARTDLPMVSGLHRWNVHVDRCISKNIFIGVSTAEARLDNYVGCDTHGWAFLANKAVWHGKSKSKTYGELFCTGDMITVSLDLDNGE